MYRIVPDSRGFLWFCTADGLSRFDGVEFKNYGRGDGQRMRHFASDLLGSRDIDFRLSVPPGTDHTPLGPHLRRELYLIFKEGLTNVARHSGCTEADIALRFEPAARAGGP